MTHRKRGLVAGVLFLAVALTPVAVVAGPLEDGANAYANGDYTTAHRLLRPLAEQGNAEARYRLAGLYWEGRGVPRDADQAMTWYERAAESGSWLAAFELGMIYYVQTLEANPIVGLPDDALVRAHSWLGIAARMEIVGCVALSAPMRDAVAQSMASEQVAIAKDLTRAWLAEHEKMDDEFASAKTGC